MTERHTRPLRLLALAALAAAAQPAAAERLAVASPDGRLTVTLDDADGRPTYAVAYDGRTVLLPSALGLVTSVGDLTEGMYVAGSDTGRVVKDYTMTRTKASASHYEASRLDVTLRKRGVRAVGDRPTQTDLELGVTFLVSDHDVAFRYTLPRPTVRPTMHFEASGVDAYNLHYATVEREATAFRLPEGTTTFLSPQIGPMTGWERTKPSYEEEYAPDAPLSAPSKYGRGYTLPCLFHIGGEAAAAGKKQRGAEGEEAWLLVSETGVTSAYCGSHLTDHDATAGYTIAYPDPGENNGVGAAAPCLPLPGATPWRTLTVGTTLAPIVETTVPYDVVEPLYEPTRDYQPGRYTWSWLVWQDQSIHYDDQVRFVDLAAAMGFEYCLVDGCWDETIGRDRIEELSRYAQARGVRLLLWYNSNGFVNNAYQSPRHCMTTALAREREMAWMERAGIAGIKVDFFGGDKQETMRLYEDILADANRHGLQVVFHGCTLPRGWERMYPNFVASEAALASENVYFSDHHARREAFELTIHPFCRNAVAAFDWGGIIMNRHLAKDNRSRHARRTTDVFELASGIVLQTSVNCVAMQPNNIGMRVEGIDTARTELPDFALDYLRQMPTTWDETRLLDGYPGRYVVLARRHAERWYVVGLNAGPEARTLRLDLSGLFAPGTELTYMHGETAERLRTDRRGRATVTMGQDDGLVLMEIKE